MRRFFSRLLLVPLALAFLLEAWLWDHLAPFVARLVRSLRLAWVKALLAALVKRLSPEATLLVFLLPTLPLLPLKLLGLWFLGRGEVLLAAFTILAAKLVGMGITAFLFELTKPKLLTMPWFRKFYEAVLRLRAAAAELTAPVRREVRRLKHFFSPPRASRGLRLLRRLRRAQFDRHSADRYDLRMESLHPFSASNSPIAVTGALVLEKGLLRFKWRLRDPHGEVLGGPVDGDVDGPAAIRANDLWRETCFEAFFGVPGVEAYWELNLSPDGRRWNLYRFDAYRVPQPPRPSEDFALERVRIRDNQVECVLRPAKALSALEASLCTVIRTSAGTEYLATAHAGTKPDFHLRGSFRLRA